MFVFEKLICDFSGHLCEGCNTLYSTREEISKCQAKHKGKPGDDAIDEINVEEVLEPICHLTEGKLKD